MLLKNDDFASKLDTIEKSESNENSLPIYVTLKNFGKTPAIIGKGSVWLRYISSGVNKSGESVTLPLDTVVGAGEEEPPAPIRIDINLSPTEATYVKESKAKVLLSGSLVYSDIWRDEWTLDLSGRYEREFGGFRIHKTPPKKNA